MVRDSERARMDNRAGRRWVGIATREERFVDMSAREARMIKDQAALCHSERPARSATHSVAGGSEESHTVSLGEALEYRSIPKLSATNSDRLGDPSLRSG